MSFIPIPSAVTSANGLTFCDDPALAAAFSVLNGQLVSLYTANSLGAAPVIPAAPYGIDFYSDSRLDTIFSTLQAAINALLTALTQAANCPDLRQLPQLDATRYSGLHGNTGAPRLVDSFTLVNQFLSSIWLASGLT